MKGPISRFTPSQLSVFAPLDDMYSRTASPMRARDEPRYEMAVRAPDEDDDGNAPVRRKRSIPDDFFAETDAKRSATEPDAAMMEIDTSSPFAEEKKPPRKRPNYLQHDDRRIIIERVARGEPQAALAREYGVTRAAVCQMYKKREKILARGGGARPSQQRGATAASTSASSATAARPAAARKPEVKRAPVARRDTSALPTVQGESKTVKTLVTTLHDQRAGSAAFRRAAARLTFILIEAALASYDVPETDVAGRPGTSGQDVEFCAITLGDESASFLTAFGQVDPDAPTGQIHVKSVQDNGSTSWKLHYLDVPDSITHAEVLLFSTFGNGGAESKAIEALQRIGVAENRISLVMVGCSSRGYAELSNRHPKVTIISATIDDEWSLDGWLRPHAPPRVVPVSFS